MRIRRCMNTKWRNSFISREISHRRDNGKSALDVACIAKYEVSMNYRFPSCQKATALAAATFKESTPWDIGMRTV